MTGHSYLLKPIESQLKLKVLSLPESLPQFPILREHICYSHLPVLDKILLLPIRSASSGTFSTDQESLYRVSSSVLKATSIPPDHNCNYGSSVQNSCDYQFQYFPAFVPVLIRLSGRIR